MSRTLPHPFPVALVVLDAEKVATIRDWYISAQGDEDKADASDVGYYEGARGAYESVLHLAFGTTCPDGCAHPDLPEYTRDVPGPAPTALDQLRAEVLGSIDVLHLLASLDPDEYDQGDYAYSPETRALIRQVLTCILCGGRVLDSEACPSTPRTCTDCCGHLDGHEPPR